MISNIFGTTLESGANKPRSFLLSFAFLLENIF